MNQKEPIGDLRNMFSYDLSIVWVGILIALIPAFALSIYLARRMKSMWLVFIVGAIGWTVALIRGPILQELAKAFLRSWILSTGAMAAPYISTAINSLFAGVFEEGIRYGLVKKIKRARADSRHVLLFGLGWGFGEAVLIYALPIVSAVYLRGLSLPFTSVLLGALERNMAIAIHVGMTFMILQAVTDVRYLFIAIGVHFTVDFVGVSLYISTGNVWATYITVLTIALILAEYARRLIKAKKPIETDYTAIPKQLGQY